MSCEKEFNAATKARSREDPGTGESEQTASAAERGNVARWEREIVFVFVTLGRGTRRAATSTGYWRTNQSPDNAGQTRDDGGELAGGETREGEQDFAEMSTGG